MTEHDMQDTDETIEEFNDAETVIQGSGPSLSGSDKREIHLLIEITYSDEQEATTTPMKHLQILNALGGAFDRSELDMFDNKGRRLKRKSIQQWRNITTYEDHFKIHQGNKRHYVIVTKMN